MLYHLTIPQFTKMLMNLRACFDKAAAHAEAKKVSGDVLLTCRLALDQFPLVRQAQIVCDTAKLGVSRLTGKPAPEQPDTETTIAQIQARIDVTIAYLNEFSASDFADARERRVTQARWAGKTLSGEEFALQHLIPNFYFHLTTAYAIMRHNGVELGKKDYLGAMPFREATESAAAN